MVGLDSAILMHPIVWEASGHVASFADPMVDCKKCKKRYRVDEIDDGPLRREADAVHPARTASCELTEPRKFNLMFETHSGPVESRRQSLPAPGDGAGDLRQLQQRGELHAHQDAVRHRADRQIVP